MNALMVVQTFILADPENIEGNESEDHAKLVHQWMMQSRDMIKGLCIRGLKSCSSNYTALHDSLLSLQRLIELDEAYKKDVQEGQKRIVT